MQGELIMPACNNDGWNMDLILPSGAIVARPVFTNIVITGRDIKGDVHLPINTKISELVGECVPLAGLPDFAAVHFRFRLKDSASEIGMLLSGVLFFEPAAPKTTFRGAWTAHTVNADTPPAASLISGAGLVLPGSGDTGSGVGTGT
jgi:hypothetical protein